MLMLEDVVQVRTRPHGDVIVTEAELSCGHTARLHWSTDGVHVGDRLPCFLCQAAPQAGGGPTLIRIDWSDGRLANLLDFGGAKVSRDAGGRVIVTFAAPYADVAVRDGDLVTSAAADRLLEAIDWFQRAVSDC